MKLPDLNDVLGLLFMIPLIALIWAVSSYLLYEIASAVFW